MKNILWFSCCIVFLIACQENTTTQKGDQPNDTVVVIHKNEDATISQKDKEEIVQQKNINSNESYLVGKHLLSLQWISWEQFGEVDIAPPMDGWYLIKGAQRSKQNDDYLTIQGKIKQITPEALLFEGTITYFVSHLDEEPCIKKGRQTFLATKGRKYWRLQDMLHCNGITTDYVDIYF